LHKTNAEQKREFGKKEKEMEDFWKKNIGSECKRALRTLKQNPDFARKAVERNGDNLRHLDTMQQKNPEVVKKAVEKNGLCLIYAHPLIKQDRELNKLLIKINPFCLEETAIYNNPGPDYQLFIDTIARQATDINEILQQYEQEHSNNPLKKEETQRNKDRLGQKLRQSFFSCVKKAMEYEEIKQSAIEICSGFLHPRTKQISSEEYIREFLQQQFEKRKESVLERISENHLSLKYVPQQLRCDEEIIEACKKNKQPSQDNQRSEATSPSRGYSGCHSSSSIDYSGYPYSSSIDYSGCHSSSSNQGNSATYSSIGYSGYPYSPSIGYSGYPSSSSIGYSGYPYSPSIGYSGYPSSSSIGYSGYPYSPSNQGDYRYHPSNNPNALSAIPFVRQHGKGFA
jgi:hypothetical protein